MKVTLLGFDPSLTKAATNRVDSDIKDANSKNNASSKNQNTTLKKTLNIYSLNIDGLLSDTDEFRIFIDDHRPDIICVNETKIDDKIRDSDIEVDNYLLVRKDRNSDGSGVAIYIYILKDLEFALRNDLMTYNLENVTIQLKIGNYRSFIVTALYRPPNKPVEYLDELESLISSIESEDKDTIMLGDTNCNFPDNSDNDTKHLKRILMTHKMAQLIKESTRTTSDTKTLTDHIIVNRTDMVLDSGVISCGISAHDAKYITKNMRRPKLKFQTKTITVRNFKKFLKELDSLPFNQIRLVI